MGKNTPGITGVAGVVDDTIRVDCVGEFSGNFPNVPTANGVDLEALAELDDDPLFVTLPVVPKEGTISANGLLYDGRLLDDISQQINTKRPGANFGHLSDSERDTAFPKPDAIWVGAKRYGDTLWAKAYVRPGAARDYIKTLRAVGGSIATSIFGKGQYENVSKGVRRLIRFDLDTLDFAPPARAALGGGVTPMLTAEMSGDENNEETIMDKAQLIAELTVDDIPATLRESIISDARTQDEASGVVTELEQGITDRDAQIKALTDTVAEYRSETFKLALDVRISELFDWSIEGEEAKKKFDAFTRMLRSQIVSELDGSDAEEDVDAAITKVWEDLKPLAETLRDALAGPPAVVGGKGKKSRLDTSPAAVAAARAKFNF